MYPKVLSAPWGLPHSLFYIFDDFDLVFRHSALLGGTPTKTPKSKRLGVGG